MRVTCEMILKDMVVFSQHVRSCAGDSVFKSLGPKQYLKEYCIIRMCLPRRSGHTTASIKVAFDMFKKPLFIRKSVTDFINFNLCLPATSDPTFVCLFKHADLHIAGREFDVVIVDGANQLSKSLENKIISACSFIVKKNPLFTIIFLQ